MGNIAASEPKREDSVRSAIRIAQVRTARRERRRRAAHLPAEALAEPAWDILLELYAFELIGRAASQTEIADMIPLPNTTSIRWMKVLEAADLIVRSVHPEGDASVNVRMSRKGLEAMEAYFSGAD